MEYQPVEGVDYIVDYCQFLGVRAETGADIRAALDRKEFEQLSSQFQTPGPEAQAKAEVVARSLRRARVILLDPDKRLTYNAILDNK